MCLLDTNVVSELRKPRPHGAVVAWVDLEEVLGNLIAYAALKDPLAARWIDSRAVVVYQNHDVGIPLFSRHDDGRTRPFAR